MEYSIYLTPAVIAALAQDAYNFWDGGDMLDLPSESNIATALDQLAFDLWSQATICGSAS